jgi:hypothetical protein
MAISKNKKDPQAVPESNEPINNPTSPPVATEDLRSYLAENKDLKVTLPRSPSLDNTQVEEVLEEFSTKQGLNKNDAKVVIAILFQSGGTNRSCDGNLQTTFKDKTIKLAYLRKALATCKLKNNERKLARALADDIALIAEALNIPGNLYSSIQRLNPEIIIDPKMSVWLSDFQANNNNCPAQAKTLINNFFEKRNSSKTNKKGFKKQ